MTGAEALLRTLTQLGVDTCFMNPGTSEITAFDDILIDGTPLPRDRQITEIGARDLVKRRVFGAAFVSALGAPLATPRAVLRRRNRGKGRTQKKRQRPEFPKSNHH